MHRTLVVIPARLQSKRLPGKVLRKVDGGDVLIRKIVRQIRFHKVGEVVVATDSQHVVDAVKGLTPAYLTSEKCRNGTERVANLVLDNPRFGSVDIILNVQADQLFLHRFALLGPLKIVEAGLAELATAVTPLHPAHVSNPNRVKALVSPITNQCVGFYRLLARWQRTPPAGFTWAAEGEHIGVYAYTRDALRKWVRLGESPLERALSLEQVRPLEAGMAMGAAWVDRAPLVVDTEDDLQALAS